MTERAGSDRHGPRERMVFSASQLIRRDGVTATGMRDVAAHAGAPRGSLQHYFPGGKDQLAAEAVQWGGRYAAKRVRRFLDTTSEPTPSRLFATMAAQWRDEFTTEGYAAGCPMAASVVDSAATNDTIREGAARALSEWRGAVIDALHTMGVPRERAEALATLMIATLEGAIVLSRCTRDVAPLDTVVAQLSPLLDAA
jgi:AcrR family transcriptional regulator